MSDLVIPDRPGPHPPEVVLYADRTDTLLEEEDRPHDIVRMIDGSWLLVHLDVDCLAQYCVIHNPSEHPLKGSPLNWRGDRMLMERICHHGVGHPDPDDMRFKRVQFFIRHGRQATDDDVWAEGVHGCCGCCIPEEEIVPEDDLQPLLSIESRREAAREVDDDIR